MTDRVDRVTVALERDIRDVDVECVLDAIMMIKGVASVSMHVVDAADFSARVRVRREIGEFLYKAARRIGNAEPVRLAGETDR